jgi:hypothetical protein
MTLGDSSTGPLARVLALARSLEAENVVAELVALAERLREGRFYVACVGQFKRGKSTLLNALLGACVLPVGVTPVTAVVTVVRYGPAPGARVRMHGTWSEIPMDALADFVAEERNPENVKQVEAVEVFAPSRLLRTGMCLVDTPGLGSVFAGNTLATRAFVPHVDAAIVVIGADPPLSGEELALIADLSAHVRDLQFVLNKADRVGAEDRAQAVAFAKAQIARRLAGAEPRIYEVSALERFEGRGEPLDFASLEADLHHLAKAAGAGLITAAETRGVARAARALLREVEERRGALTRPLEESEARMKSLRQAQREAEQALSDLGALFTAEEQRLSRAFEAARVAFLAEAAPAARREVSDRVAGLAARSRSHLRHGAMSAAQDVAEQTIAYWLTTAEPEGEALFRAALRRFIELANGVLARVVDLVEEPVDLDLLAAGGFDARRAYHFESFMTLSEPGVGTRLVDACRSSVGLRAAVDRGARAFLDRLLDTNSQRVANDLRDRVRESRRGVEREIRRRLRAVVGVAERALERASSLRARKTDSEQEVRRLEAFGVALRELV